MEAEVRDDQRAIDDALQLVNSQYDRLISRLAPAYRVQIPLEELRTGPLGRDLQRLSLLAQGKIRDDKETVLEAIESVLQLLFWPAGADDYTVPRSFWESDLGKMLAQAKYRAYEPHELVSIGSAAQALGVTRPTIYRWMDERTLNYVRDEMSGRTFVVRQDIENRMRVGAEFSEEQ